MKKNILKHLFLFIAVMAMNICGHAQPKKVELVTDEAEIAKLEAAVLANPDSLSYHEQYIKSVGLETPRVEKQYDAWMKQFPNNANVAYAIGHAYASKESPKAKPFLLKAVAIDPKYDKAWFDLWIDGERWGDFKTSASYLLKAKEAAPDNADYAFYYANTYSKTDLKKYTDLSLDVAKKFPNTERGAQALYWLANRSDDQKAKVEYYEQQKRDFPPDKFSWTSSGMSEYFSMLLMTDQSKAVALAESMAALNGRDVKSWQANIELAKNIAKANEALNKGKADEAVAVLDKVTVPRYSSAKEDIALLKANAMSAAGKTDQAYRDLVYYYAKEPSKKIETALSTYGSKLNKNKSKVDEDVWYIRDTSSKDAPNFTLDQYFKKGTSSLSDYKGKVVLLTYWFPGCGPCRGEFPHFENVVRKFKGKDLVYLGINIVPDQDDYVVPFMKSSGYSFIPLRDNTSWEKGPLNNRNAAPVNFLIDQNGKIIFFNFRTDGHSEETLEMMIASMLERKKGA
ncbi:MAG: redoxin domain-containing protein [Flavisolibacter sp.]|jgi:thiol-disulfide isomerase/thioredoxin